MEPPTAKLWPPIDFQNLKKIAAMELEIHPGFGFIDSTRGAMSKFI